MSTWHLNSDRPLYTRHPEPRGWTDTYEVWRFDRATLRLATAVHEAGHAVLSMAIGIPLVEMHISDALGRGDGPGAWVRNGGRWSVPCPQYIAMCAAGERAQDRWMHEKGLWTVERAWATERGARDDRRLVVDAVRTAAGREVVFGGRTPGALDYATAQTAADAALAPLWDRVLRLAAALDGHGHLTGCQAARYADLTRIAVPYEDDTEVAA